MIDLLKNAFYTGLGAAELTKEKIEELAKELAEKGKLSESEMKKFVDDALSKSEERKEQLKNQLEQIVEDTIKKMNLVSRTEFDALEKKLQEVIENQQKGSEE
ncbi:MAG: hypothetical protein KQH63_05285 [Desulfobulbaceae bacterium]|nr:hypothetical protein [Desulfobulbaceae bacterium]